jgi:RNA polymerase sigma-70 factor (ECF subfamily)
MPELQTNFQDLMQQVIAGSEEAAAVLLRDYEPILIRAIRKRLDKRLRSKFDSIDFAQDVWASFFADDQRKRNFQTPEELLGFLTRVAQYKVADKNRQRTRLQKYNVTREQSMDDSTRFDRNNLVGDHPTPSQIVMSQEEWTEFLRKQPLVHRRIFILLRDGKTATEIAAELDISAKTVRRVADQWTSGTDYESRK